MTLHSAEGTPHGIKETAGLQALDQIRFQIARQMNNETLLCPIDNFLEHYGPTTVKAADVKKCKKFLITSNLFDEETGRWTDFAANPSQYEDKEDRVFQDLKPIVDKIFEFAKGRRNNYKFQVVEHKYLEADIPGTNHKMDGCLVDGEFKTGKIPVRFIKSPHEYKKQRNVEDQRMVRTCRITFYNWTHHLRSRFVHRWLATVNISFARILVVCLFSL